MKKFFKSLVAVASALAIFGFGFIGCSSGDDDDDVSFTAQTKDVDLSSVLSAVSSADSSDASIVTAEYNGTTLTLKSVKEGTASVKVSGTGAATSAAGYVNVTVSVDSTGAITATVGSFVSIVKTVCWDFASNDLYAIYSDEALTTEVTSKTVTAATGFITGSAGTEFAIYADATTKIYSNSGENFYVSSGDFFQIPVSNGSVVTVCLYPNTSYCGTWTFGGNKIGASSLVSSLTATSAGYIKLAATANGYLQSITVTNLNPSDSFSEKASTGELNVIGTTTDSALFVQIAGDDEVTNAESGTITAYFAGIWEEGTSKTVTFSIASGDGYVTLAETEVAGKRGNLGWSASTTVNFKASGSATITASIDGLTSSEFSVEAKSVEVSAALAGDAVSGVKDTSLTGSATISLTNDTFSSTVQALSSGADATSYISLTPSADTVTVSAITVSSVSESSIAVNYTLTGTAAVDSGTISATLKAGALSYTTSDLAATGTITLNITESKVDVTALTFSSTSKSVVVGGTIDLADLLTVTPENATDSSVAWSVSTGSGATVDEDGLVTVSATGETVIKATANGGTNVSATFTVTGVEASTQLYNFFTASFLDSSSESKTLTSASDDTTSAITVKGIKFQSANYGGEASNGATISIPTSGADTMIIAYVTYLGGASTTSGMTLSDSGSFSAEHLLVDVGSIWTPSSASVNTASNTNGTSPYPLTFFYTGGKDTVILTVARDKQFIIGKIVVSNDAANAVKTSSFDFTNSSYYSSTAETTSTFTSSAFGSTGSVEKLYVYNTYNTYSSIANANMVFHSEAVGMWAQGAVAFTFPVGGSCTITPNANNGSKSFYVMNSSGTMVGNGTANGTSGSVSYSGDADVLTVVVESGAYWSALTIAPTE